MKISEEQYLADQKKLEAKLQKNPELYRALLADDTEDAKHQPRPASPEIVDDTETKAILQASALAVLPRPGDAAKQLLAQRVEAKRIAHHAEVRRADKAISHAVVRALLAAGYAISVDNGEGFEIKNSTDVKAIFKALAATDEDYVYAVKDGKRFGWVRLIYGESGWDLICDYTVNLESVIGEGSELQKTVDYWEARLCR